MFGMRALRLVGWNIVLIVGCSQSSGSSQRIVSSRDVIGASAEPDEVSELLGRYQQLTVEQRNSLAGDKMIMQVEALLKIGGPRMPSGADAIVRDHNQQMVRRALQDPDLLEVIGTELAPTPRER
jgi:hypothetical protein